MLVTVDRKTDEVLGVAFLEGPAEYLNEMFARGPAKTAYGEQFTDKVGGAISESELEKTTPVSEEQLKSIFPYATATKMTDPLTNVDKVRIHDNIRRDGATKRALLFICYFMMPEPPVPTLALNRKYATKQREQEHMMEIQNDPEYLDILEDLLNRDEDLDLYTRQIELAFSANAYGRSVQVKQYDGEGFPKRYIPLPSTRLGPVWIDKYSWEFLGVEFKDYTTNKRILMAKDIIHLETDDFNVTPNARYYGMSLVEPTMAIGERNRAANEIALPEIMKRMFAPMMLVKSKNKSQEKLNQIRDAWKSGKTVFYNNDIEIIVVPIPHDLEKIRDTIEEGNKQIFRDATVPVGVGWQGDQNRSTFEGSVLQWYQSVLAFKRSQFSNTYWRQHYKPQLELIYENRNAMVLSQEGGVMDYLIKRATNPQSTKLPFTIKLEFKDVRTVGFLDLAAALAQYGDRGYLSADLIRVESGFGKYNDEMAEDEINRLKTTPTPTFTAMDNTMNTPGVSPNADTNLSTQSTSVFDRGLPTANKSTPDRSE